jgi:hypothetical protein
MAWYFDVEVTPRTESLGMGASLATTDHDLARAVDHCGVDIL